MQPVKHGFHYRLFMNFLDLAEVPALLRARLLSEGRFSLNGFLRRDHFGDPRQPLADSVRELVQRETGLVVDGPIRLLTQLRTCGYYFSPLSLFYCYAAEGSGSQLQAVVAEVQNTPWLERHCYVLWQGNQFGTGMSTSTGAGLEAEYRHPKSFHVSPFLGMDMDYRWRLAPPAEHLQVGIDNMQGTERLFRATLQMQRIELSRRSQWTMHCRYPLMTARITAAIYLQAFCLWRKKCPIYQHPKYKAESILPQPQQAPNDRERSPVSIEAD